MMPHERLPEHEYEQLKIPEFPVEVPQLPKADPVIRFCVDGIRLSLSQNILSRQQAIDKIKSWYPGAEILLDEKPEIV